MIGVLNINKPKGITSSQVVVKIKKLLQIKKVGHMGTLDPLASGVLPICVGKATRLFDYFLKKQKTYIAKFTFGTQTSTLDLEGEVVETSKNIPKIEEIEKQLNTFLGEISQVPPMYSSKKVGGKKAYDIARAGKEIDLKPCKVTIYEYKLLKQIDERTFEFLITCSAGTYIRALARDLGKALNSCATMSSLLRIKTGNFTLENSINFEALTKEILQKNIIPLEEVLADFEKITISKQNFQKLLNGQPLKYEGIANSNKENQRNIYNKPNNAIKTQNYSKQINNSNNPKDNNTLNINKENSTISNNQEIIEDSYQPNKNYVAIVENKIVGIGCFLNNAFKIKTYLIDD